MLRALVALAVLSLTSAAMAQIVVGDDEKETPLRHNPSYDNLYRPGNAIWRLRMLRMGLTPAINDVYADLNTTMDNYSVESSAVVADPIRIYETRDVLTAPSENYYRMQDLLKDPRPTTRPTRPAAQADEGFLSLKEPNRDIQVKQLNPRGPDIQPAIKGEVNVRPYDRSRRYVSPIAKAAN